MEYEYKTVTFGCTFSTKASFNEKLQEILDDYSEEGWKLHTMQIPGSTASMCVCVFERERE